MLNSIIDLVDKTEKPLLLENASSGKARAICIAVMHMAQRWGLDNSQIDLKLRQLGIDAEASPLMRHFTEKRVVKP